MLYVLVCDQEARLAQFIGKIKTDAKNFYYISKEEYIMLTGKDI